MLFRRKKVCFWVLSIELLMISLKIPNPTLFGERYYFGSTSVEVVDVYGFQIGRSGTSRRHILLVPVVPDAVTVFSSEQRVHDNFPRQRVRHVRFVFQAQFRQNLSFDRFQT